jgi:hypothetical protein
VRAFFSVLAEDVAEVFVDDAPLADGGWIEKLERLSIANYLVEWLGDR